MTHRGGRYLSLRFALPVAVAFIAAGCRSKEEPTQSGTGLGAPAAFTIPPGGMATSALLEELAALPRGPKHERRRKGLNCNCANWVTIQSVGETRDINPADGPMPARLVAYIENQDLTRTTEKPRFKPKSQAIYYVQVSRDDPSSRAKWRLLEFPAAGGGSILAVDSGWVNGCGHAPADSADADFKDCSGHHFTDSTGLVASVSSFRPGLLHATVLSRSVLSLFTIPKPSRAAMAIAEDPTWISCNAGCCTLTSMIL
jgi:hypothetical protein